MNIEQFVAQSEGKWRSMRSGHSLAFQQFEDVLSEVQITPAENNDADIENIVIKLGTFINYVYKQSGTRG